MNAAYILCAIVGGGLVAASLLGAFDQDVSAADHDVHITDGSSAHGVGHDGGGLSWASLPVFSPRFWIFSVAAFGLIGTILSLTSSGSSLARFIASALGGLTTGLLVWLLFRLTARVNTHEVASAQRLSGERATVTVAIRSNTPGKIRMHVQGQVVEVLATTDAGQDLDVGSQVFVLGMSGHYADVVPYDSIVPGGQTFDTVVDSVVRERNTGLRTEPGSEPMPPGPKGLSR